MKIVLYGLVCLMTVNFAFGLDGARAQEEDETQTLISDLFTSEACSNPCWLGIEILVTNEKEVSEILTDHEIEYQVVDVFEGLRVYNFELVSDFYAGITPGSVWINPMQDRVGRIDIPLEICADDLIMAFGEPDVVLHQSYFELFYLEDGLIFYIDIETQSVWAATVLTKEFLVDEYTAELELQTWEGLQIDTSSCS